MLVRVLLPGIPLVVGWLAGGGGGGGGISANCVPRPQRPPLPPLPAKLVDAKLVEELAGKIAARELAGKTAAWNTACCWLAGGGGGGGGISANCVPLPLRPPLPPLPAKLVDAKLVEELAGKIAARELAGKTAAGCCWLAGGGGGGISANCVALPPRPPLLPNPRPTPLSRLSLSLRSLASSLIVLS